MATVLNQYCQLKEQMYQFLGAAPPSQEQLMLFQELLYRISVLETSAVLCKSMPTTTDQMALSKHYCVADAFLICLLQERRFGLPTDEAGKNQRNAAHNNLNVVITSFRNGFNHFHVATDATYREKFNQMMNTVLPAWLAYRNTYIKI